MKDRTNEELVEALFIGLKTIFDAPVEYRINVIAATNDIKKELLSRLAESTKAIEKLERITMILCDDNLDDCEFRESVDEILAEEGKK